MLPVQAPASALRRTAAAALTAAAVLTTVPAAADPRVGGEIGHAYEAYYGGARGFLGEPLTQEVRTPNGRGAYVVFQRGSVYWSPATGAREVHGQIRDGWGRLGWEGGHLGFPLTDERRTTSRSGAFQDFEGGRVYWSPWTGAHALRGEIREAYDELGEQESPLGFPTSSELRTPGGTGAYNTFQWGALYWSHETGAQPVRGEIRRAWAAQGWEGGCLGFPTAEEVEFDEGAFGQQFQGGLVFWSHDGGPEVQLWDRDPELRELGYYPRC